MVTGTTEVEMAPIQNGYTACDKQELVRHNDSLNSFNSESNEVTVTRWIDQRKYSMMSFKPCEKKNVVDIVVTTGETSLGKQVLLLKDFTSQDIRSQYSTKAKAGFAFILLLLLVMVFIIIVAMVTQPWNNVLDGNVGHTQEILHDSVTRGNNTTTTTTGNFTYT